jgi:5-oxoprolinase (ATP-hydrolysing)
MARWEFWIDRGGTFTDVVGRAPDGSLHTLKLLSENPDQYRDAAIEGMRRLLQLGPQESVSPTLVAGVKLATTVATNALLERRGEPTVLLTTRGFRDALRIATQARPRLFDLHIKLPEMLYQRVIEADERIGAQGEIIRPLDQESLSASLRQAHAVGYRACAIVFMHGYRYPQHEVAAAELAGEIGFSQISASHRVSPLMKLVPRGDTTVVDAYLSPILQRYCRQLAECLPGVPLLFMQSSGGLTQAQHFHGKDAILSGPAGGIVGMARTAQAAGYSKLIGFDMGGTSTDVSHFAGEYERVFDTEVAGVRVRAPMLSIHSIAAGGGSIIRFDGTRLRVGPQSAGANPGPACYRRGGPLTITDANVLLGRIQPRYFPQVFGPRGDEGLDEIVVQRRFEDLAGTMRRTAGATMSAAEIASGALRIAVGSMANAVKRISVSRGHDVSEYTLQCFGGAGGQHACLVSDALGISRVYIHPLAGVLSAYGMGLADRSASRQQALEQELDAAGMRAARVLAAQLGQAAQAELVAQGVPADSWRTEAHLHMRYHGTDTALLCGLPPEDQHCADAVRSEFERQYRQRYALEHPNRTLIIEAVSVACTAAGASLPRAEAPAPADAYQPSPERVVSVYCFDDDLQSGWREAQLHRVETLRKGAAIDGPAILAERNATTIVEPGWQARIGEAGAIEMRRTQPRRTVRISRTRADPVMLELFNNLFMNIAEQMGLRLQNTASSVNIKERLDFSCALFDAAGELIANAPHMPVHLGSMSESIRSVIARNATMRAGDVFVLNDPYHGGTHLPDITVVTPVFLREAPAAPSFFVASRGHHADVGGITPGSVPPFSTRIEEEGVLIDNFKMIDAGEFQEEALRRLLEGGAHPARNPEQNVADLAAQVAANEKGVQELEALVRQYGHDTVAAYMRHVQDNAEESVRRAIGRLKDGEFSLPLDNGACIRVVVRIDAGTRSAVIDFTGCSAQLANNFNAPRAITTAAVLYVFRTLVDDDIPLNAGCLRPLKIVVPEGSMLNPRPPAAVVAGNVETSSCVTNALYGALGTMAGSQCTMNNSTFGNGQYQYYETISGGSGAGPGFNGTSVVQTHMTNSRLTDPEVLEFRFPVRVDSYEIRSGSGGGGRFKGGEGGVRRVRFLEPMTASILSNGRLHGAFGAAGGEPGSVGENRVERADGRIEVLGHIGEVQVAPGDVFVITTPGGGGHGSS